MKNLLALWLAALAVLMLGGCLGGGAGRDAGKALKTTADKAAVTFKDATADLVHDQRMVYARNIAKLFEVSAQGELDGSAGRQAFLDKYIPQSALNALKNKRPEDEDYKTAQRVQSSAVKLWNNRIERAGISQRDDAALRKAFAEFACQGIGLHEEQHGAFATLSQFNRTIAQLTAPASDDFSELMASLRENSGQIKGLTPRKKADLRGKNFENCVSVAEMALAKIDTADLEAGTLRGLTEERDVENLFFGGIAAVGGVIEAGELLVRSLKAVAKYALQEADKAKRKARFEQFLANGLWAGVKPEERKGKMITADALTALVAAQSEDTKREAAEKEFTNTEIAIYRTLGPCALVGKVATGNTKALSDELFDPVQEAYFGACMTGVAVNKDNSEKWKTQLLKVCNREPSKAESETERKAYRECKAKLEKENPELVKSEALITEKNLDPVEEAKFSKLSGASDEAPLSNQTLDTIIQSRTTYAVIPPYGLFAQGVGKLREAEPQLVLAGLKAKGKNCNKTPDSEATAAACVSAAEVRTKSAAVVTEGMALFEQAHNQLALYDGLRAKKAPDELHRDLSDGFRNLRRIANGSLTADEWYEAVTQTVLDLAAAFDNTEKALGNTRDDANKFRDTLRELAKQLSEAKP